ncbi:MAG: chorismate mutase [Verrucomicrobia bacterium]|nr:chorismate mutase [Verrucomicrobiota bacterium]
MSAPDLQPLRRAIDGLDDALTGLLVCRVCLSHQAQALKVQAGLPTLDPGREAEIQGRYERRWCGAAVVARAILNLCRED